MLLDSIGVITTQFFIRSHSWLKTVLNCFLRRNGVGLMWAILCKRGRWFLTKDRRFCWRETRNSILHYPGFAYAANTQLGIWKAGSNLWKNSAFRLIHTETSCMRVFGFKHASIFMLWHRKRTRNQQRIVRKRSSWTGLCRTAWTVVPPRPAGVEV